MMSIRETKIDEDFEIKLGVLRFTEVDAFSRYEMDVLKINETTII